MTRRGGRASDDGARASYPAWFDDTRHVADGAGVIERATGVRLGEDGQPASAAERALRKLADAAADAPETPEKEA